MLAPKDPNRCLVRSSNLDGRDSDRLPGVDQLHRGDGRGWAPSQNIPSCANSRLTVIKGFFYSHCVFGLLDSFLGSLRVVLCRAFSLFFSLETLFDSPFHSIPIHPFFVLHKALLFVECSFCFSFSHVLSMFRSVIGKISKTGRKLSELTGAELQVGWPFYLPDWVIL